MPEYSPSRLTVARCVRGYTKKDLADHLGITRQAITNFESGATPIPLSQSRRVAFFLGFPHSFFEDPDIEIVDQAILSFRSRRRLKASVRDIAAGTATMWSSIIAPDLRRRYKLPIPQVPQLFGETPEKAAKIVREEWKLGDLALRNVLQLMESKGVHFVWMDQKEDGLEACSFWRHGHPYVIVNERKQPGDRQRFTAAHELGHLVLHSVFEDDQTAEREEQANRFAQEFLLPERSFRADAPRNLDLTKFAAIKPKWGCSIQAMVRRTYDLGIFSEWQYTSAQKQISMMGWRSGKPEPAAVQREHSLLHKLVLDMLATRSITPADYATSLNITPNDFIDMMPAAKGFVKLNKTEDVSTEPRTVSRGDVKLRFG